MDEVAFGRYRLLSLIGEGGMGKVYKAHDTMIGRDVAIKVLPPELGAEPGYRERFRREAHTAARLTEPHIIPIYDTGEIEAQLYLVMPVIDGIDLQSLLHRDGPMSPQRAVRVIEQLAAALHVAHTHGLVHRDIKPSNAILTGDDFVYLIDFGIAHDAATTRLTGTGMIVGTFAYMAPERFTTGTADARADVYALACVLYECLTGAQPYPGKSLEQQITGHLTLDPPKPSSFRPAIAAGFDDVIAAGMAKNPDERYQSARELATAAQRALASAPPPAPAPQPLWQQPADLNSAATRQRPSDRPPIPQPRSPDWPPHQFGTPPPPWGHRRRPKWPLIVVTAVFLAASAGITAYVLWAHQATTGESGPASGHTVQSATSTPTAPSSTTSQAPSTPTTTSTPPTVAPNHLSSILLVPQEADPIMGATGMQDLGGLGSPDTNFFQLSNPDCLGAAHIVQPSVYADSGYTAILFDVEHEPGNSYTHSIEQAVTSYPSAGQALAFVTGQVGKWKACAGQNVTDALKGASTSWTFGDLVGDAPKIALRYNRLNARGWTCQHALSAVLNVVIDVKACAFKIDNEGIQVADKIAAKAAQ